MLDLRDQQLELHARQHRRWRDYQQQKAANRNPRVWFARVGGAVIGLVIAAMILQIWDYTDRAERLADEAASLRHRIAVLEEEKAMIGIAPREVTTEEYATLVRRFSADMRQSVEAEQNPITRASLAASYYCRATLPWPYYRLKDGEVIPETPLQEHWNAMMSLYKEAASRIPEKNGMPPFEAMVTPFCPGQ